MEKASSTVTLTEFKILVQLLKKLGPEVSLRLRLQGEMWTPNFIRLINLLNYNEYRGDFTGVVLNDEVRNKLVVIKDLKQIIQFEIDKPVQHYRPFTHYTVVLFQSEPASRDNLAKDQ